jgi:hypothetical protein
MKTFLFAFFILVSSLALKAQQSPKYTASFIAEWAGDTVCIETFTIVGKYLFGKAIHLFPEPHLEQFIFEYNERGAIRSLDIQHYTLENTAIPLKSKTGLLPYAVRMRYLDGLIDFEIIKNSGTTNKKYEAERIDYLGSWIPIFGQWQYLSSLVTNSQLQDSLHYVNWSLGVYDLDLKKESDTTIVFYGELSMPLTFFLDTEQLIDSISGIGSAWNFEITRHPPIDIDQFTKSFAKKSIIGIASPRDTFHASINGTNYQIKYFRPLKRDRKIFGHIVPYDRVWRAGANWATKISFDQDQIIEGTRIPKGTYNIFTIPRQDNNWTLILNSEENAFGSAYRQEFDIARMPMQARDHTQTVEQFTIELIPSQEGAVLTMSWDEKIAELEFKTKNEN